MKHINTKQNLRKKQILIASIVLTILIIVAVIVINPFSPYPKYMISPDNSIKQYGDLKVESKKDDNGLVYLTYPSSDIQKLNEWVKRYTEESSLLINNVDTNATKTEIFQDFESYETGKQFISVKLKTFINREFVKTESRTFDTKTNEEIDLKMYLSNKGYRKLTSDFRTDIPTDPQQRYAYLSEMSLVKGANITLTEDKISILNGLEEISVPMDDLKKYLQVPLGNIQPIKEDIKSVYIDEVINPTDKMIAFTFDDGPHSKVTPQVIETLNAYNGKGTFFMLGSRIEGNEEILKTMIDNGHQLANHSFDHPNLNSKTEDEIKNQINSTNELIKNATGYDGPIYVRPPYGNANELVLNSTESVFVNWSVDTEDWRSRSSEDVCNAITSHASDGAIILTHDIYQTSYEGFKCAIDKLSKEGYRFVTVEELLKSKTGPVKTKSIFYDAY